MVGFKKSVLFELINGMCAHADARLCTDAIFFALVSPAAAHTVGYFFIEVIFDEYL